jgi:leader peptidase (prepilin peptidase)/N-methyltransferase
MSRSLLAASRSLFDRARRGTKRTLSLAPSSVSAYTACGACVLVSIVAAPWVAGLLGGALAIVMLVIAAIDARYFIIPDELVLAGLALGLVNAAVAPAQTGSGFWLAVLRAVVLAALFFAFREAYRRLRRREGIGLGDVKLAAVAGLWLSWMGAAVAIDVAALAALAAVLISVLRGRRISGATRVPFGLFFAPAIWLAWLLEAVGQRFWSEFLGV